MILLNFIPEVKMEYTKLDDNTLSKEVTTTTTISKVKLLKWQENINKQLKECNEMLELLNDTQK